MSLKELFMVNTFKSNFKSEDRTMVSLSVNNVGFQKCEPGYQWGPGIRDHFLIHHIVSGKGFYEVGNVKYELQKGDSFLVYPFMEITYYADKDDPWEYYWVGFQGTDAATILNSTDFNKHSPVVKAHNQKTSSATGYGDYLLNSDEEIKKLLLSIYDARGNSLENAVEMTGRLYSTLSYYIRISEKDIKSEDSYAEYVKKAIDFILSNYSYPISIEEIADYVGVSRSHLFRSFRMHLNTSPKEYLTSFRIKQACSLLRESDLSIIAISKSVGFENNLYFSKAFKKVKGMSPTEYGHRH